MEEENNQQLAELLTLNRIARVANAANEIGDVLPLVATELIQAQEWDRVIIGLTGADHASLHVVVQQPTDAAEDSPFETQYATPNDLDLIREMLNAGEKRVFYVNDHDIANTEITVLLTQAELQTLVAIPLVRSETILGVLVVGNQHIRNVSTSEIHLLDIICDFVSVAVARIYQFEQLQEAYEKAKQVNRVHSAFLATVTHELRAPATSIIGYAQMLQRGRLGPVPPNMEEPISYMLHSSTRMHRLVNDLLEFAKMEAGHLEVDLRPVDITPIIENVHGIMKPLADEKQLELLVDIEPDIPRVAGNGEQIERVLTNLLSNAVKFTDNGGVTIRAYREQGGVCVSVQDTGIGISPEHHALIFGEYQQVRNRQSLRFAGTGLGLAISRRMMGLMEGDMTLESQEHKGSTFFCHFKTADILPPDDYDDEDEDE